MRIIDWGRFPGRLQQERHILIMTGIFPIDEKAVACKSQDEGPHNPEDLAWHALAKERHADCGH